MNDFDLSGEVKVLLPDRRRRIELSDLTDSLTEQTVERVLAASFSMSTQPTRELVQARIDELEKMILPAFTVLFLGGYYGDEPYHERIWRRMLERLRETVGSSPTGTVYSVWDGLRYYPVLLGLYALGIGCLAGSHPDTLARILASTRTAVGPSDSSDLYSRHPLSESAVFVNPIDQPNMGDSTQLLMTATSLLGESVSATRLRVAFDQLEYMFELIEADKRLGPDLDGDKYVVPREFWLRWKRADSPPNEATAWASSPWDRVWTKAGLFDGQIKRIRAVKTVFDEAVESERMTWQLRSR